MKLVKIALTASLLIAIVAFAMPLSTANAAGVANSVTITITQDQINSSYWVTNPPRRSVTNRGVALGNDVVVLTQTVTLSNGKSYDTVSNWVPHIYLRSHDI